MMIDRSMPASWAILPVKAVESAKQRLRDVLSERERQQLFHKMLADVMAAILKSKCLAGLAIVTRDPGVIKLGNQLGARIFKIDIDSGQSAAVSFAARTLASEGVVSTISLPADVPLMSGAEIDAVCRSIEDAPSLTIVPNFDGTGTNCLACSAFGIIGYAFGTDSFARHRLAATKVSVDVRVLRPRGLCLDIDERDDLVALLQHENTTRTQDFLVSSGIAARLLGSDFATATGSKLQ